MNTKSQQELLEDTQSKIILFVGSFGSGKTTAIALKALDTDYSIILNLNHISLTSETIPAFKTVAHGFEFRRSTMELNTKTCRSYLRKYNNDESNFIVGVKRFTFTLLLDNFCSLSEEDQIDIYTKCLARAPKQLILFINPVHIRNGSFVSKLLKNTEVINASLYDNIHIPEDYIKRLNKEAPFVTENNIKGFF